MSKHTDGPWEVSEHKDNDGRYLRVTAGHHWIATLDQRTGLDIDTQRGNAKLVASAPTILEALKYARDVLAGTYDWKLGSVGLERIDAAIRAAEVEDKA